MTNPRAARIAAVREVMGWTPNEQDPYEDNIAELAAELVDAVMAVVARSCSSGPPKTWPPRQAGDWRSFNSGAVLDTWLPPLRPAVPPADTSWIQTTEQPKRSWWKFWRRST